MDLDNIAAGDFGRALTGFGINLLVKDVFLEAAFLQHVFLMQAHQVSPDFSILRWQGQTLMLHGDSTYHSHPYLSWMPEAGPRGLGAELRLYHQDPDQAQARVPTFVAPDANHGEGVVLQSATDKPHGLREAYIASPSGYCWVPSIPIQDAVS